LKPLPAQQQQSTDGSSGSTAQSNKAKAELQAVLDRQMAHVDRLEKMPSPYLWQVLEDMEKRLRDLKYHAMTVEQQIENSTRSNEPTNVVAIIKSQNRALNKINNILGTLHARVEVLREQYRFYEKEENVLDKANWEEQERERQLNDRIRMEYVKAASTAKNSSSDQNVPPGAAAPGSFGAPAPSGFGGFGAPSPAPTTAGGGFNFSSTPAPAGGAFGGSTTPGPAPIGGVAGLIFLRLLLQRVVVPLDRRHRLLLLEAPLFRRPRRPRKIRKVAARVAWVVKLSYYYYFVTRTTIKVAFNQSALLGMSSISSRMIYYFIFHCYSSS